MRKLSILSILVASVLVCSGSAYAGIHDGPDPFGSGVISRDQMVQQGDNVPQEDVTKRPATTSPEELTGAQDPVTIDQSASDGRTDK